jgi:hypothetical protein
MDIRRAIGLDLYNSRLLFIPVMQPTNAFEKPTKSDNYAKTQFTPSHFPFCNRLAEFSGLFRA